METKLIVDQLMETVDKNKELIDGLQKAFSEALDGILKSSAKVIVLIEDEKQAYEVLVGVSYRLISDSQLDDMIKLPFYLEPFDGIAIKQFRPLASNCIIKLLDKHILDRFGGENWFVVFKQQASNLVNGI